MTSGRLFVPEVSGFLESVMAIVIPWQTQFLLTFKDVDSVVRFQAGLLN